MWDRFDETIPIPSPEKLQAVSQTCADLPLAQQDLDEECRRLREKNDWSWIGTYESAADPEISMEFWSPDNRGFADCSDCSW